MLGLKAITNLGALTALINLPYVTASWDPSTGNLPHTRPTASWLQKNPRKVFSILVIDATLILRFILHTIALVSTPNIQVAECAHNTRLAYPKVQIYAYFKPNRAQDFNHGCTGQPGYEENISGAFNNGPEKVQNRDLYHDARYPRCRQVVDSTTPWPKDVGDILHVPRDSLPPKCGAACEMNGDPGLAPGTPGAYQPHRAVEYEPYAPTSPNWPTCAKGPDGKIKYINRNPQSPNTVYCKQNPGAETCANPDNPSIRTTKRPNCIDDPHGPGCPASGGNESGEVDCKANPQDARCGSGSKNGSGEHVPNCKTNPHADGCPQSQKQPEGNKSKPKEKSATNHIHN
ncbi:hypothetical protein O181_008848 [Austropuccinia psidii MF-1]|uniref:Uncharacterized protein n=1 Tax=Austropuccinia psidii MF-1 TaxID=1389203 RepID=A0A9Q3GIW2_9BASI|nr:hypothetical protein [Austropuccinia psidii MF-1]